MRKTMEELKEEFLGECLAYIKMGQQINPVRVEQMINALTEQADREIDEQNEAAYSLLVRNKKLEAELKKYQD